jgi:hypothetical protein
LANSFFEPFFDAIDAFLLNLSIDAFLLNLSIDAFLLNLSLDV